MRKSGRVPMMGNLGGVGGVEGMILGFATWGCGRPVWKAAVVVRERDVKSGRSAVDKGILSLFAIGD